MKSECYYIYKMQNNTKNPYIKGSLYSVLSYNTNYF